MDTLKEILRHEGTGRVPRARRERQILAVAVEHFGLHGYAAASVAAIAAQVGVTKTLVHHYFGSKHELHLACLAWASGELLRDMDPAVRRPAAGNRTEAALRSFFAALNGRPALWLLLADAFQQGVGDAVPVVRHCRDAVDRIASSCTHGLPQRGSDEESAECAALRQGWWGLVTGLVRWWTRHPEQTSDTMADHCARLLAVTGSVNR